MIKSLQKKMITVSMLSISIVIFCILAVINVISFVQVDKNADSLLDILAQNGGSMPQSDFSAGVNPANDPDSVPPDNKQPADNGRRFISAETPYETRYFTVSVDSDGNVTSVNTDNIAAVSSDDAGELAARLVDNDETAGFISSYKYRFVSSDSGGMYIFVDCAKELNSSYTFLGASVVVGAVGLLLVFLLVILFSRAAVKPTVISYEKQKQFITDAGHELKTPLTIIEANTEVIEMESGESEWTRSTKNQVRRLSELTAQLIMLARLEESEKAAFRRLSLSNAVAETAKQFDGVAVSMGKSLKCDIEPDIDINGDEKAVCMLTSILLDNAMKYSTDGSEIEVKLYKRDKNTILSVYNKTESIEKGSLNKLFERFYRADSSRNSATGGSGIGLSAARAIVLSHGGKIAAESADGKSITITASFKAV